MPNNKDDQQSGAGSSNGNASMDNPTGRGLESDEQIERSGRSTQGLQSSGGYGKDTGDQGAAENDDITTAGGREGHFSDKTRDSKGQWSPGASGGPSDE